MDQPLSILNSLPVGPLDLQSLIAYQEGSIVSKPMLAKETGTVTLFAFDSGQSLSEHSAPFDALVSILDGDAEIRISQKPYHVRAGEIILLPANQPHALKAPKRFKMLLTMIRSRS